MIVYNHPPGGRPSFFFFESRDLMSWRETSVLEDEFECPNLIVLPVDGNSGDLRWVIWGSSSEYRIGSFDGSRFRPDGQGKLRTHHGPFTASQVFANAPAGRVVQVGWAHCCNFDREFSQMASFPLDLSLRSTPAGVRLHAELVEEIGSLRLDGWQWRDVAVGDGALSMGDSAGPAEILIDLDPGSARFLELSGSGLEASVDLRTGQVRVQDTHAIVPVTGIGCSFTCCWMSPSVELTINRGSSYFLGERAALEVRPRTPLRLNAKGGTFRITKAEAYPLMSIHEKA